MFTVLIAEKHYIDAIRLENNLFFEPFLENNELAFCCWNPDGQSLKDSVPGLVDTVGRKKEWRVIVINSCSDEQTKYRNPFDLVDCSELNELISPVQTPEELGNWGEWEKLWQTYYDNLTAKKEDIYRNSLKLPLQKLSTWLNFKPTDFILNDVYEKDDIHEWAINEINKDGFNSLAVLEKLEREQYRKELKIKEIIRREFVGKDTFEIAYPREFYCVSLRNTQDGFFNPDSYWNMRSKNEYSEFCDRNMYFDKMRFLVFDILPDTHKNYRCDKIKFLSTLLIFACNDIPGGVMEARKLYILECKNDDSPLFTIATSYDKKLAATYDVIENEIDRIYGEIPGKLTDKAAEALFCTPVNIEVKLSESCNFNDLYSDCDFSILPTYPEFEAEMWNKEIDEVRKSYGYIIRQQKRSVKRGIDTLDALSELSGSDVCRLTPFQLDDIRDFTENAENEMIDLLPPDISNQINCEKFMQEKTEAVNKILNKRMSKNYAFLTGIIILALVLILFLPFVTTNISDGETLFSSLKIIGILLSVLVISLLISLIVMKLPLISAIKDFNNTMHAAADDINENMRKFSNYFSIMCCVRRGFKVQKYADKNVDEYTQSIHIRRKHQEDIKKKRAELYEAYNEFIGNSTYYENTMIKPYDFDFEQKTEYSYIAPFPAGFRRNIDFLEAGNQVEVPTGYITHISVRLEEIYDK